MAQELVHRAPLVPTSPLDISSAGKHLSRFTFSQSQIPMSPPLLNSESQGDGYTVQAPQPDSFTPPDSVSMSAEPSQQGTNNVVPAAQPPLKESDGDGVKIMAQHPSTVPPHSSTKRKLSEGQLQSDLSKRRRTDHDRIDEQPRSEVGDHGTKTGDFSSMYKLCIQPHSISRPHPTQNLISLYGLDDIAASVARKDPVTGEKINKLRKSYEGKIKDIIGRNKATSRPREFFDLLQPPDDWWQNEHVKGRDLEDGITDELVARLEKAVVAAPGKLPAVEGDKWRTALDTETSPPKGKGGEVVNSKGVTSKMENTSQMLRTGPSERISVNGLLRPKRRGTKRSYADDSFEGYGEGYVDDKLELEFVGDDDGDSRSGSTRKKRRKDSVVSPLLAGVMGQHYAPSTVSVGSGSFGRR